MFMFFSVPSLMADDGGSYNFEDWTYGNIYVKEPNNKIALEKELMECDMDSVRATFIFKNTTKDTVVVDCAFPIVVKLPYKAGKTDKEDVNFHRCYSYRVLRFLLGTKEPFDPNEVVGPDGEIYLTDRVNKLVHKHDKELRMMNIDKFYAYMDSLKYDENEFNHYEYIPHCEIVQDGKSVALLNVGIESSVTSDTIYMRFHFHHKLTFLPNSYSKLFVIYNVESSKSTYDGFSSYYYDISTGGTWKDGTIKSFIVATRNCDLYHWRHNYLCLDEYEHCGIYSAMNYKPVKGEYLKFIENYLAVYDHDGDFPEYKDLNSIALKDVKPSASFHQIEAMMDRDRFTSCTITNWENATLEFTLPKDGYGPYMYNGTIGSIVNRKNFHTFKEALQIDDVDLENLIPEDSSVYNYNRVSEILIERLDKPSKPKVLKVNFSDPREYPIMFDWSRFNDIEKPYFYPAGRYRITIKNVDFGNKSQDTTLITEFCFLPIGADMTKMILDDRDSKFPIFQTIFQDLHTWIHLRSAYSSSESIITPENDAWKYLLRPDSTSNSNKESKRNVYKKVAASTDGNQTQEVEDGSFRKEWVILGVLLILFLVGGIIWLKKKNSHRN